MTTETISPLNTEDFRKSIGAIGKSIDQVEITASVDNHLNDLVSLTEADNHLASLGFYRTTTLIGEFDVTKAVYSKVRKKDVRLSYTNSTVNGPGQVVTSLLKGLTKLGVQINTSSCNFGILQPTMDLVEKKTGNVVAGPNICVLPSEMPNLISGLKTFLVPSKWTYDKYVHDFKKILEWNEHFIAPELKCWSAGIDVEVWKPSGSPKPYHNCFIYYKNRSAEELRLIKTVFENQKMSVSIVEYGTYTPEQLFKICEQSSFCVLLDNTESQGIAVMQILSMNVPLFVLDKTVWMYKDGKTTYPATSVPFFDERCGKVVSDHLTKADLDEFFMKLSTFKPRQYILENHTLTQAAGRYMECFK